MFPTELLLTVSAISIAQTKAFNCQPNTYNLKSLLSLIVAYWYEKNEIKYFDVYLF